MKSLKPSMRENKRYLLVNGKVEDIEKAITDFLGISGASKVALKFIEKDKEKVIIAINREAINNVRASLCIWPEKIEVTKVSGTIKGLKGKK